MNMFQDHISCAEGKLTTQGRGQGTGCRDFEERLSDGKTFETRCDCCDIDLANHPEYLSNIIIEQQQLMEDLWS